MVYKAGKLRKAPSSSKKLVIVKLPRHRPERKFSNAKRVILECSLIECVHCGAELALRRPRHMRKTVQTMDSAVFVAGKSKECTNPSCTHFGKHYYATGVLKYSLPYSTYGLDVLAFIGWEHEHEHQQLDLSENSKARLFKALRQNFDVFVKTEQSGFEIVSDSLES